MPPTQKELAKLAGLSAGTVSNVISGMPGVSEHARKKVMDAIRALNYQPNLIARSLKTNKTYTLGMVVPDITIPFYPKVIRGAESAAREAGYFLIVLDSESNHERERAMIHLLQSQRVEGILLVAAGGHHWTRQEASSLTSAGPVVCLDRLPDGLNVDSVCVDDCQAAEMAVSHLMSLGHRNIAIVTGPQSLKNEQERLRGYTQALRRGGNPVKKSLIWSGSFDAEEIGRLCQQGMLQPNGRPTAIFSTNGVTGLAVLRSLYALGMSTPEDFAFLTFDELTTEDFFRPCVSSVMQPAFDIGHKAVEVLLRRINGESGDKVRQKVRLPATLEVRESTNKGRRDTLQTTRTGEQEGIARGYLRAPRVARFTRKQC